MGIPWVPTVALPPLPPNLPPRWQCQLASVHLFVACERGLWRPSCGVYVVIIIHLIVFGWLSLTKLLYKQHHLNLNCFDYISQFILIACSIILCICNYTLLNFMTMTKKTTTKTYQLNTVTTVIWLFKKPLSLQ